MKVDSIQNGIVIDHITAGRGMLLYELLGLDAVNCSVALIKNGTSRKMGKKDIIKIDGELALNLDIIGYVDPCATVNIIRGGVLVEKKTIPMPRELRGVIKCKNPRCITSVEQELEQVFLLRDPREKVYRCLYCETQANS